MFIHAVYVPLLDLQTIHETSLQNSYVYLPQQLFFVSFLSQMSATIYMYIYDAGFVLGRCS